MQNMVSQLHNAGVVDAVRAGEAILAHKTHEVLKRKLKTAEHKGDQRMVNHLCAEIEKNGVVEVSSTTVARLSPAERQLQLAQLKREMTQCEESGAGYLDNGEEVPDQILEAFDAIVAEVHTIEALPGGVFVGS